MSEPVLVHVWELQSYIQVSGVVGSPPPIRRVWVALRLTTQDPTGYSSPGRAGPGSQDPANISLNELGPEHESSPVCSRPVTHHPSFTRTFGESTKQCLCFELGKADQAEPLKLQQRSASSRSSPPQASTS